jgi:hypothetical protein
VRGQHRADQVDICGRHLAPLHNHDLGHGAEDTATDRTESNTKK